MWRAMVRVVGSAGIFGGPCQVGFDIFGQAVGAGLPVGALAGQPAFGGGKLGALIRQVRTRPVFSVMIRPSCSSTRRCLRKAGSPMAKGWAKALTGVGPWARRLRTARRVGSAKAWKAASRVGEQISIWQTVLAASGGQGPS